MKTRRVKIAYIIYVLKETADGLPMKTPVAVQIGQKAVAEYKRKNPIPRKHKYVVHKID